MKKESVLLRYSVIGALFFAVLGVVWGLLIQSQMLLFDGVYSFLSVGLSLLSVVTARFIRAEDEVRFPFGKSSIEPLVITFKYFAILLMCFYAFFVAAGDLLSGGREVNPGHATLYAFIALTGCYIVQKYLRTRNKNLKSKLVEAEANQWLMDTVLSVGVLAGFGVALGMAYTPFAPYIRYVDPLMVLLVSGYFMKVPLQGMIENGKELLGFTVQDTIRLDIEEVVKDIQKSFGFEETFVRVTKLGRRLFIEIDFVTGRETTISTIVESDKVRNEVFEKIEHVDEEAWLTISFTADRKWAL
ncbi:cation diffusion facilitator family transporter [Salsuginibacillus kocurii]|uniref:cation diffusion facilitator family transporter n=1 Tax=Salsuginibacillus kocurii TaxID=427078 RepID=UPI000382A1E6|nr:cation transporter [Salsuginibacillus kocurii]